MNRTIKHGMTGTQIYCLWARMKRRCADPRELRYYGRVMVCERWQDFQNFYADMGDKPTGASLERIDNEGDYEPRNVRWATAKEQSRNRVTNRLITINGETKCLRDWCNEYGTAYSTAHYRLRQGQDPAAALTRRGRSCAPAGTNT